MFGAFKDSKARRKNNRGYLSAASSNLSAFTQYGNAALIIAELGIGTNPMARLRGNIITDQKVLGTVHVAVGRNL